MNLHKLSFPTYDGKDDPLGWLNKCEHFFRAQRTREADKVWLASFHLTGTSQHWFYMLEKDAGDISAITWSAFRSLCQQRFGPPLGTNHLSDLARLQFRGSVADYQETFQARLAHAGFLTPEQQVQLFTGGLPDPIRTDVELHAPADLQCAMALARAYERRAATAQAIPSHSNWPPQRQAQNFPSASTPAAPSQQLAIVPAAHPPPKPFKRLSPQEMAERRRQGLCYNCDEPYVRGHKCPRLFYLEVTDFDDNDDSVPPEHEQHEEQPPLISLHAIAGIFTNETMKVYVNIGEHQLVALLDSGSTTNFINMAAAHQIGLHFHDSPGASVIVANGDRVACRGQTRNVPARIGEEFFGLDFYAMPLDHYDMVLGISFLKRLGPIL